MTVTLTDMRNFTGLTSVTISDDELTEHLSTATSACTGYMNAHYAGASGDAFDSAVKYMCCAGVRMILDLKGIKPDSWTSAGITMSTNVQADIAQLKSMADYYLGLEVVAQGGRDMWIRHIRSGKTTGRM